MACLKVRLHTYPSCRELWVMILFDIKNDIGSDPGCNATNLRATFPAMASHIVKGLPLFRNKESINFAIPNLVDLPAKSMADFLLEESINPSSRLHCLLILFYILKLLPANH